MPLDKLHGNAFCLAHATNVDGSVIVGQCRPSLTSFERQTHAAIWNGTEGVRSLESLLAQAGVDLQGFSVTVATGVSADGKSIVGYGINARSMQEAWLVRFE